MLAIELVDRPVDLLPHGARQLGTARRGQALNPFLLQARLQLGFAAALLAVALVALGEIALKGAIVLAGRGGEEVGDAHIHSHRGRVRRGLEGNLLLIGEREPPAIRFAQQRHAAVKPLFPEYALMIGGQADR
jgi:hypothetical protein